MNARAAAAMLIALTLAANGHDPRPPAPATPIQHLVVIFGENISFDHYFGTYPVAANPPGEPRFDAAAGTPAVDGLTPALLTHNPNLNPANGSVASNPFRLDRTQAATASQSHEYTHEQLAYHRGAADLFPKYTGHGTPGGTGAFATRALVMGYYDGNTVTALWRYAQHFAMSDNAYGDQYGPSSPGAINLISGQTNGVVLAQSTQSSYYVHDGRGGLTLIGDVDPAGDVCSNALDQVSLTGKNIGDLLNAANVTWGWFEGGFDTSLTNADGSTGCARGTASAVTGRSARDYIPHHEPFQYYRSTANPRHARPLSVAAIGSSGDATHHQYDIRAFFAAVKAGTFPAVAFLKASAFQDAHAGYSDPLDEQTFVTEVVNFLEQTPEWPHTAVIILYDDSDGWYDHRFTPVTNASFDPWADQLDGPGACGVRGRTPQLPGVADRGPVNGRCGPGARQPFLIISPWARVNYVDHTRLTQSSVIRFIEDNWLSGRRLGGGSFDATAGRIDGMFDFAGGGQTPRLFLDTLGAPVARPSSGVPE
ncbi:MAG TPA: alkaline phosphatase family protein [Gemmatimonadales bacterium]|nr:alkaline phosphatase family protein [Gemmatimonadales bacterium]